MIDCLARASLLFRLFLLSRRLNGTAADSFLTVLRMDYCDPPGRFSAGACPGPVCVPMGTMMRAWGVPSLTTNAGPPGLPSDPMSALVMYGA
jgi:hypothetical protein